MNPGLVLRTLAHLRREQLIYRPLRLIQSRLDGSPLFNRWTGTPLLVTLPSHELLREMTGVVTSLPHLNQPLSEIETWLSDLKSSRYTFLNKTLELKSIDWNARYQSHLWSYCLHYFTYSYWCARAFVERGDQAALEVLKQTIASWIDEARPGRSDGWQPYPVSLRVVNWTYAYSVAASGIDDLSFLERWARSIYRQLEFLESRIEYHLLANHILKNAKAMLIGGLFFEEKRWIRTGRELLMREIDEQVLPDGGHFERAPMYHAQVVGDILEALEFLRAFNEADRAVVARIEESLRKMSSFLRAVTNPDGTLGLFNDSANTYEMRPVPLLDSLRSVLGEIRSNSTFPESGYFAWHSPDGSEQILVDAGPPSASYNTAHAHCDLLSYELWLNGRAFVVDSGVHGYDGDRFREYSRSTRAHNTVMFDGCEQSEVWATFRMGGRANAIKGQASGSAMDWMFCGSYSPYSNRRLIHERRIERNSNGLWRFSDRVLGGSAHTAESFIHLHPDISVARRGDFNLLCDVNGKSMIIEPFGIDGVEIVRGEETPPQGWYFPDFGVARPTATIRLTTRVRHGEEFGYNIHPT